MNMGLFGTAQGRESLLARLYEPLLGGLLAGLRAQILALCQELGLHRVLDVCCGPAGCSKVLQQGGIEVCGLDFSWPMLRQAQQNIADTAAGVSSVPALLRADATRLPFASRLLLSQVPPNSLASSAGPVCFDAAVLVLALHTMPFAQAQAVVREALRVAPLCIVADYRLAERNIDLPAAAFAHSVEWLVGGEHYASYKKFMAAGAVEGFVRLSGFRAVLSTSVRRRVLGGAGGIIVLGA